MGRRTWVRGHYRTVGRRRKKPGSMMIAWVALALILGVLYFLIYYPAMVALLGIAILGVAIGIKVFKRISSQRRLNSIRCELIRDTRYIPNRIRRMVLARDSYQCCECGSQSYLEMDHIIPLSKGGATSLNNLQTLCRGCNLKKGNS